MIKNGMNVIKYHNKVCVLQVLKSKKIIKNKFYSLYFKKLDQLNHKFL